VPDLRGSGQRDVAGVGDDRNVPRDSRAQERFRQARAHRRRADVAAQAEYWYEDEREELAQKLGTQIDVFVDPAVHPEHPRLVWGDELPQPLAPIRVGDEFEVELLHTRLPNPTSAAAIVAGR
jgi:hypothetical protein